MLDFGKSSDADRKVCSLYLGLMDRMMGSAQRLDNFGDSTGRLENI